MAIFADDAVSGLEVNGFLFFVYLDCVAQADIGAGSAKDAFGCIDVDDRGCVFAAQFSFLSICLRRRGDGV